MTLKEIRDHISSIRNLKNITSIVDKVSIIKLQRNLYYLNNFKDHLYSLEEILSLALNEFKISYTKRLNNFIFTSPLIKKNSINSILSIFYCSDKGLCGFYNQNIASHIINFYQKSIEENQEVTLLSIGKKAALKVQKKNIPVKILTEISERSSFLDDNFNQITKNILLDFKKSKFNQFILFYTDNKDTGNLSKEILLPFPIKKYLDFNNTKEFDHKNIYTMEDSIDIFLDTIIQEIIKSKIYYNFIKSVISENILRHLTASRASDKSDELIHDLNIKYNKIRQNKITQEISEIISSSRTILK